MCTRVSENKLKRDSQTGGQTDRQTDEQTDRQTDRRTDGRTDGQMDERTNGQIVRQRQLHNSILISRNSAIVCECVCIRLCVFP